MSYIIELVRRYTPKGILIDTNILLLLFVGSFDTTRIAKFKRTQQFTVDDYNLLTMLIEPFRNIYTTPNILTEVSNLAGQLAEGLRLQFFPYFGQDIIRLDERCIQAVNVSGDSSFHRFGLTDSVIAYLANSLGVLVLTDDLRLANYLQSCGLDAINFNHIRTAGWH